MAVNAESQLLVRSQHQRHAALRLRDVEEMGFAPFLCSTVLGSQRGPPALRLQAPLWTHLKEVVVIQHPCDDLVGALRNELELACCMPDNLGRPEPANHCLMR